MDLELIKKIRILGSSISVLVAEDEEVIREQLKKMLSKIFESVDTASNGVEALELYEKKRHDLLITDLKMPLMDGLHLCRSVMHINKEQNILLLSAYNESRELLELINIGISGFLVKPIDMGVMLDRLYISAKNIYSNKMMKYHYEQMRKQLQDRDVASEEEILNTDALTSLYNHKYLLDTISSDENFKWAVMVNINDFKLINDYYSYAHGNHLLYQIAQTLKSKADTLGYTLFKLSADEFVLLRNSPPENCEEIESEAKSIQNAVEKNRYSIIGVSDITVNTTFAVAKSIHRLIESLHQTLRYAKSYGLKYAVYEDIPDATLDMKNVLEIKNMLQSSIENSSVIPVYQPIVMKDGSLKYEVLMRIKNLADSGALISPGVFLDIAKKHSYYNEISDMVIFKAIEQMRQNDDTLSINFSYADMNNAVLLQKVEDAIVGRSIAHRLIFEVVETEHLDNIKVVKAFIERFKTIGVRIAIDDFGSGYSNFAHIFTLEPDFIKIDGSLVSQIIENEKISVLVRTIIDFAHKLGVEVVAEHVSTKELHDALWELGVDALQGYYIGRPAESMQGVPNV